MSLPATINKFGEGLFQVLAAQPPSGGGIFLSPYGIAQALGMLLNGVEAGGPSAAQLQKAVFGDQLGLDALNAQLQQLSASLTQASNGENLTVADANSVWVAAKYALQPAYSQALAKYFDAQVETITTAEVVNAWVSKATRGKIKEIVSEGVLHRCLCVLINAVYFKGLWSTPFEKMSTGPVPFSSLRGGKSDVAMMFHSWKPNERDVKVARFNAALPGEAPPQVATTSGVAGWFGLGGGSGGGTSAEGGGLPCIAVQLPYQGGDFAAVVAMPEGNVTSAGAGSPLQLESSGVSYSAALASCRAALLGGLGGAGGNGQLQWAPAGMKLNLWLPRFEIEFETSLTEALQKLGVTKPFEGGDITRVAAMPDGTAVKDLVVSDVIHKVYIKAAEEGLEAAAVTAILAPAGCAFPPAPPPELNLRFDRPFAFAVAHLPTGTAVFAGAVEAPEPWQGWSTVA